MPHTARHFQLGIYHIVLRGYHHFPLFQEAEDKEHYISLIYRFRKKTGARVCAFLIQDSAAHLLMEEDGKESISDFMRRIGISYSRWLRKQYIVEEGPAFRDRFSAARMTDPAGIVRLVSAFHYEDEAKTILRPFSSAGEYYSMEPRLDIEPVLEMMRLAGNRGKGSDTQGLLEESREMFAYSDEEVRMMLQELCEEADYSLSPEEAQQRALRILKKDFRISVRQLSRVSGVSKSSIDRLR